MAELIDHKVIDTPALWAVGTQAHILNQGDNPLPAEWQKQIQSGLFNKLMALDGLYSQDDYVGIIHSWPGDMSCFEYLMGMLFTQKPDCIPDDCTVYEIPAGSLLCGYVRGIDPSYVVAQAHDLVMARADRSGYTFDMNRLFLIEGYNRHRFIQPDDQGRIVFDYYIPVKKKACK